jgi:hypothetical protein
VRLFLALLPVVLLSALPAGAGGESLSHQTPRRYAPAELLVRFTDDAGPAAQAAATREHRAVSHRRLPVPGLELVKLRRGTPVQAAEAAFERDPRVLYAEPNFYY